MATLHTNIIGSPVMLYDEEGNKLAASEITGFDRNEMRIEVANVPDSIKPGDICDILIICPPTPWEYKGRVLGSGLKKRELALFKGKMKEARAAQRYKVEIPAGIESLVSDGQVFKMHTPVTVKVVNISKTGVRFAAKHNTLAFGDIFHMHMKISADNEKRLEAEVMNTSIRDESTAEFGCRFLSDGTIPVGQGTAPVDKGTAPGGESTVPGIEGTASESEGGVMSE
jgi:hypothetical protein